MALEFPRRLWVDTETTGLDPKEHQIVQISALLELGTLNDTFNVFIKPTKYPDDYEEVAKIHGLTKERLEEIGIPHEKAYAKFTRFLGNHVNKFDTTDKLIFAGYNARFDEGFIRTLFKQNGDDYFNSYFYGTILDVQTLVAILVSEKGMSGMHNLKLETLARFAGIEIKAHDAHSDIEATAQLYKKLMKFADLIK